MKTADIYALVDPRDQSIRYIGKATKASDRLKTHLRDCKRRNTPVYCWIRKLLSLGLMPEIHVIETVCESAWAQAEKDCILKAKAFGEPLLNLAEGGDQPYCSPEARTRGGKNMNRIINERKAKSPKYARLILIKRRLGFALAKGVLSDKAKDCIRRAYAINPKQFACFSKV